MPIPTTRDELVELVEAAFAKLRVELDRLDPPAAELHCVDDWRIKDLLAVRAWWTERVVDWIEAGRRGESPMTPAPGYGWRETPRLNADIVRLSRAEPLDVLRKRLDRGYERVRSTIDALDDVELLDVGSFGWAGRWPIARWISINTARQYTTARSYMRRALRGRG